MCLKTVCITRQVLREVFPALFHGGEADAKQVPGSIGELRNQVRGKTIFYYVLL